MSSYIVQTAVAASSVPNAAAGKVNIFVDIADGITKSKDSSGTVVPFRPPVLVSASSSLSTYTIVDEDFFRGFGALAQAVTLPNATGNAKVRNIKNTSSGDMTITGVSGQTIDGNANLVLRGGRKQSVTLMSEGGLWFII
jgi:hypothetical protein